MIPQSVYAATDKLTEKNDRQQEAEYQTELSLTTGGFGGAAT
jgi:hypothetical protein